MFSVIIPTFNAGRTLERCLLSLAAQEEVSPQVVVVDGQSSDDTLAVVQSFVQRLPGLVWVSEPDKGIYDAMNKGVTMASQPWLMFLGADDALAGPGVLAEVARHLDAGVDLLHGKVLRESTGRLEGRPRDRHSLLTENICQQAIFYRKTLLQQAGPYNLRYRICADWDLNIRCFALSDRQRHLDLTVARYSGTGISATQSDLLFLQDRLNIMARAYQVGFWHRHFRSARHVFLEDAHGFRAGGQWLRAAQYYALFAYHGIRHRFGDREDVA